MDALLQIKQTSQQISQRDPNSNSPATPAPRLEVVTQHVRAHSGLLMNEKGSGLSRDRPSRKFCEFFKAFFKNLWHHKLMLGTGLLAIGVGLFTVFVDVVGLGLPIPFLAPITHGSIAIGGALIVQAILTALYETINDTPVTLRTGLQKRQLVFDLIQSNQLSPDDTEKLYDALVSTRTKANANQGLVFSPAGYTDLGPESGIEEEETSVILPEAMEYGAPESAEDHGRREDSSNPEPTSPTSATSSKLSVSDA